MVTIIGHYIASVRIAYVVCVNFIYKWWDLEFKVGFEQMIVEKTFKAILPSLGVFVHEE